MWVTNHHPHFTKKKRKHVMNCVTTNISQHSHLYQIIGQAVNFPETQKTDPHFNALINSIKYDPFFWKELKEDRVVECEIIEKNTLKLSTDKFRIVLSIEDVVKCDGITNKCGTVGMSPHDSIFELEHHDKVAHINLFNLELKDWVEIPKHNLIELLDGDGMPQYFFNLNCLELEGFIFVGLYEGLSVNKLTLKKCHFMNASITGCKFTNTLIENSLFDISVVIDSEFRNSTISNSKINESEFHRDKFYDFNVFNNQFTNTRFTSLNVEHSFVDSSTFDDSYIRECVSRGVIYLKSKFVDIKFWDVIFKQCVFTYVEFQETTSYNTEFKHCQFKHSDVDIYDNEMTKFTNSTCDDFSFDVMSLHAQLKAIKGSTEGTPRQSLLPAFVDIVHMLCKIAQLDNTPQIKEFAESLAVQKLENYRKSEIAAHIGTVGNITSSETLQSV